MNGRVQKCSGKGGPGGQPFQNRQSGFLLGPAGGRKKNQILQFGTCNSRFQLFIGDGDWRLAIVPILDVIKWSASFRCRRQWTLWLRRVRKRRTIAPLFNESANEKPRRRAGGGDALPRQPVSNVARTCPATNSGRFQFSVDPFYYGLCDDLFAGNDSMTFDFFVAVALTKKKILRGGVTQVIVLRGAGRDFRRRFAREISVFQPTRIPFL